MFTLHPQQTTEGTSEHLYLSVKFRICCKSTERFGWFAAFQTIYTHIKCHVWQISGHPFSFMCPALFFPKKLVSGYNMPDWLDSPVAPRHISLIHPWPVALKVLK